MKTLLCVAGLVRFDTAEINQKGKQFVVESLDSAKPSTLYRTARVFGKSKSTFNQSQFCRCLDFSFHLNHIYNMILLY